MNRFEAIWRKSFNEDVSVELTNLVRAVYNELEENPINLKSLRKALEGLLVFLATKKGKTNANCRSVDLFFSEFNESNLEGRYLPKELQEIIDDMGSILHDTVLNPEIAKNFESTPEQLLERLQRNN